VRPRRAGATGEQVGADGQHQQRYRGGDGDSKQGERTTQDFFC
jgi:hypothetical protein